MHLGAAVEKKNKGVKHCFIRGLRELYLGVANSEYFIIDVY
jgi:hypothetical protein